MAFALSASLLVSSYVMSPLPSPRAASQRCAALSMDETILEKALAGELEQEGKENIFLSEVGWAEYLDKSAGGSYNMNQRVSQSDDGYYTADVFSNPADVIGDWLYSLQLFASDPLDKLFPTISNDASGNRNYPKGTNEVKARTIKPKEKNFDKSFRVVGIPGFNAFGSPSSKQDEGDDNGIFGFLKFMK